MSKLKSSQIYTMISLFELKTDDEFFIVNSNFLSARLNLSQQAISTHLIEFEKNGLIESKLQSRKKLVRITDDGLNELNHLYNQLDLVIGSNKKSFEINGTVFTGLGEGAYYVHLPGYRTQFINKLGFDPYPGTLNVRLSSSIDSEYIQRLNRNDAIHINSFNDKTRTYGQAWCFNATLNSSIDGAILIIERTHHDTSVLELIFPIHVRSKFHLNDDSSVKIIINS